MQVSSVLSNTYTPPISQAQPVQPQAVADPDHDGDNDGGKPDAAKAPGTGNIVDVTA